MKHYKAVDFLKGYSIFTIVLMHLIQSYMKTPHIVALAASFGGAGVHTFFLLSGFGLSNSMAGKTFSVKDFYKRRFFRLYVPYIIVVLISSLLPFMYSGNDRFLALLSHLFLFKMFVSEYQFSFGGQFWFISTIIQFYLVFPLLLKMKRRMGNTGFMTISLVISILWWIFVAGFGLENNYIFTYCFAQFLWEFSLGMICVELLTQVEIKKYVLFAAALAGLILYGIMGVHGGALKIFNDIPSMIGYTAVALLIYCMNLKWLNSIFLWISKISYEWYLIHSLVFICSFKLLSKAIPPNLLAAGAFAFSILAAVVYKKILDKSIYKSRNSTILKYKTEEK